MKLLLVGGFLGSGKTTAILEAATLLKQNKKRVGVITNDQGTQQVDTRLIRHYNIPVEEVAGGCFCCNFKELDKGIEALQQTENPDIIFAESVGSCTDLAATVINPLLFYKEQQNDIVLTVFADVLLLCIYLQGGKDIFYNNVNYIYGKQLEEADVIVVNKIDLLNNEQLELAKRLIEKEYGNKTILYQNSLREEDIQVWMNVIMQNKYFASSRNTPELDYDLYGSGEAEMAWLDEEIDIYSNDNTANEAAEKFIHKVYLKIIHQGFVVGHLKFLVNDGFGLRKMSFTATSNPDQVIENGGNAKAETVKILINARVQTAPALLAGIISESIEEMEKTSGCKVVIHETHSFKPGYPKPTHRFVK